MIEIKPGMVVEMKTGERYLVGKYNADSQNGASTEKLLAISLSNFKINYHLSSMIFIEADKVRKVYKDIKCNEVLYFAKEIMLDEVEKEYLSAFIKPFKNRVINIMLKESSIYKDVIFMQITLKGKFNNAGREEISLPRFKKGTMYKKLYVNNPYTLKELDLE